MKAIGPNFAEELRSAGLLGLSFAWGADGNIQYGPTMTPDQIAAVQAVYAAHDPLKPSPALVVAPTAQSLQDVLIAKGLLTITDVTSAKTGA